MNRPGVGITFDASTSVRDTIDGLGRVEDLAFAPNDDRLVLLAFERNSIALCDVEIAVGDRPQVRITSAVEFWSPYLHEPHGVDFLDDTTVVVANRRGDVVVVRLPSCDASAGAALTPNELPRGAGFDLLAEPSSLTIMRDPDERVEVLVCNNATHTVTSHELAREPLRVTSSTVLLRRFLECPDGVAVDADGQWLAVSSHDSRRVMLYERARALDEHAEPDAILLGAHTPHGLRFGRDGRHLFVADASSPYLHVFARPGERWRGVEHPVASVRVRDEDGYQRALQYGRTNAGAKGVALDRRGTVLAVSSWNVPVTFFDVSAIQERTAGQDADHALRLALELDALEDQSMAARVEALEQSTSYRVTKPLRAVKVAWVRRRRR